MMPRQCRHDLCCGRSPLVDPQQSPRYRCMAFDHIVCGESDRGMCTTLQMGSVIGVGIVVPIVVYRNRAAGLTLQAQLPRVMRAVQGTLLITTGIIRASDCFHRAFLTAEVEQVLNKPIPQVQSRRLSIPEHDDAVNLHAATCLPSLKARCCVAQSLCVQQHARAHRCMTVCCSAAVVGAARMLQLDADGIHDRAYRLRYNDGQNRTDRFSTVRYCSSPQCAACMPFCCLDRT